jgi:ubiquinone/menaquinone biosynthesis C-methylase UbiE
VRDAHLTNVEIILGDVEKKGGTSLRDGIVDAVIASNILFQVKDKDNFVLEIKRILKPGGKILLVDWSESPVVKKAHIVPKAKAREMFEKKGIVFDRDINAGEHHYGMIFIKS